LFESENGDVKMEISNGNNIISALLFLFPLLLYNVLMLSVDLILHGLTRSTRWIMEKIIAEETAVASRLRIDCSSLSLIVSNHRTGCAKGVKDGVWSGGHRSSRKVAVINLDPANDSLPYDCAINIEDLIKLSDVMNEHSLGPNGGLLYCMDYLEKNIDWLESKLKPLLKDHYFLFDFPGQVELFFLHSNAKKVIMKLIKKLDLQLTMIHLIDSHLCSDPGKYVSALLLTLSTMLHMEVPHVNVLSKMDLIESYGKLAFNLDFYTDVEDLSYLQNHLDQDPRSSKYRKLTKELCEDKESVTNLVKLIDKTNGYIFQGIDASAVEFSKIAIASTDWEYYRYPFIVFPDYKILSNITTAAVQEKYMKDDEVFDSDEESNNNEHGNSSAVEANSNSISRT
ncbi:GPN-loop GTPase QQT1, partial [Tanacetum coccineum]